MMRFEDKVVIITGASSGIGEGVAKKFLEEGALVVGCGIEPEMHIQNEHAVYVQADLILPRRSMWWRKRLRHLAGLTSWSAVQALPLWVPWRQRIMTGS